MEMQMEELRDKLQAIEWDMKSGRFSKEKVPYYKKLLEEYENPYGPVWGLALTGDNQVAFSYAAGFESMHGTARRINAFMIASGMTTERLDSLDFLDARFVLALRDEGGGATRP